MGAAPSVVGTAKRQEPKRKNSLGLWTADEKRQIAEGEETLRRGATFAAEYFFYGVPVTATRQSVDPLSPMWITADPTKALQRALAVDEIAEEWKIIRSVPTTVMITPQGKVVIIFERSTVKYDLTIECIVHCLENNASEQPIPLPPLLEERRQTSLSLHWVLEDPPGLTQYIEVQFRRCRPSPDVGCPPLEPHPWQALVSKSWDNINFLSFTFENLHPGTYFQFRLRCRNHKGWTLFSEASVPYQTLPGKPSTPQPPTSSAILPHATHLSWRPPAANGAAIERYVLEGRAVGDSEFIELFSGMMLSHVVFNLHPEFAYNFRLKAINAVGESEYSDLYSLQTPAKFNTPLRMGDWRVDAVGNGDHTVSSEDADDELFSESGYANAQRCADAWRPHYDHKTGQMFYFNVLTGARQLHVPAAIQQRRSLSGPRPRPDGTESELVSMKDDREIAMAKTTEFRLKRFRFMRDLRRLRQDVSNSTVSMAAPRPLPHSDHGIDSSTSTATTQSPQTGDAGDDNIETSETDNEERFAAELHELAPTYPTSTSSVFNIDIDRTTLLVETYRILSSFRTGGVGGELRKRLRVTFKNEAGIDVGGLTKEFYLVLSKQMMRYAAQYYRMWLRPTASGKLFFSEVTPEMLTYSAASRAADIDDDGQTSIPEGSLAGLAKVNGPSFVHFMGRVIGKALYDQQMVDAPLCGALLAHMTRNSSGKAGSVGFGDDFLTEEDIKDLDPVLHQSLSWIKQNDITDVLDNSFTVVGPGGRDVILCKDGDKKSVTEENKIEYIKLMIQWKAMFSVSALLSKFLEGFWELIPLSVVTEHGITAQEVDMMLNGKPSIDVEEIRAYTIFQGEKDFNDNHPQVIWLWQIVREFKDEHRRAFLKFVTGTSRVPLDGYDPPFNLTEGVDMVVDSLPRAHTCFNQLVIPCYSSLDMMRTRLKFAVEETEGFQLS